MGVRNQERRRAKLKAREQERRRRGTGSHHTGASQGDLRPAPPTRAGEDARRSAFVDALAHLEGAINSAGGSDEREMNVHALADPAHLATDIQHWPRVVATAILDASGHYVRSLWRRGWQPVDLARVITRELGQAHAAMTADLITVGLRDHAPATVDERWETQLRSIGADPLGAPAWWGADELYLQQWCHRRGGDTRSAVATAVEVLNLLHRLPTIEILCPPPGQARRGALNERTTAGREVEQRMLDRVRALLAKAESTQFEEEASALTAKAQELMARHSIDYALLAARGGGKQEPVGIRVGIDNPYESAKSLLLDRVARANRCAAVWSKQLGFATVIGFPADLEAVELLYTSLLVQATTAMVGAGSRRDALGRSRTRSFRQSFLNSYAIRIGQRLNETAEEVSRAASEHESDLLPVLAARDDDVRRTVREMFPGMTSSAVSITDREGWASGIAAANLANLSGHRPVGR